MNWHNHFTYNPSTGELVWKERGPEHFAPGYNPRFINLRIAGRVADRGHKKYVYFTHRGKYYAGHRVVWEMHNGQIPEGMVIDHINGDGRDNRLQNLRLATRQQNYWNTKLNKRNKSGYRGVMWDKKSNAWRAQIASHGRSVIIGNYPTAEEAGAAYEAKAMELHGEFSGTRRAK